MSEEPRAPAICDEARQSRLVTAILLLAILALGAFLRFYGSTDESVWWDEFSSLIHLEPPAAWQESPHYTRWSQAVIRESSPDLPAFWRKNRQMDPATMPLYYTLEFLWHGHIGRTAASLRVLSILIGLLVLPAVYLLGRDVFGRQAGLIAMVCVALSPIHWQFAQEIRMYGLMTLLAVLSIYTFYHLVQGGKWQWWLAHALVDLFLFWTHPFAIFVPFVEGLFWLTCRWRDWRRLALWVAMHALLAVPVVLYVSTINFYSQDSTDNWMKMPAIHELVADLFADDCIGLTYQLRASTETWALFVSEGAAAAIIGIRRVVGRWAVLAILAAVGWFVGLTVWRRNKAEGEQGGKESWKWPAFFVLWWVLPPIMLFLISLLWRPCIMPRYTLHCSIAMYVLLGGAVAACPWRFLRVGATAAILLFYGYQQMLVLHGPQHTDYQSAARYVDHESRDDDLILVHNWLWKRVFTYNLGPVPNVISYAATFDVLAEQCAWFADLKRPSQFEPKATCTAWVIVRTDYYESGPDKAFEKELVERGLSFAMEEFGGIQHVLVYHVWRDPATSRPLLAPAVTSEDAAKEFGDLALEHWRANDFDTAISACHKAIDFDPEYSLAYSYLGMSHKEKGEREEALDAFRKAIDLDPFRYAWTHVNVATLLNDKKDYEGARQAIAMALEFIPENSFAHTTLGYAHLGAGDVEAAIKAFEQAITYDAGDPRPRTGLDKALEARGEAGVFREPPNEKAPPS